MADHQPVGRTARARGEAGTALLLLPAGALIVMLLAAILVDSAVVFLAEREVEAAATATANDLATLGINEELLRKEGRYELDPAAIAALQSTLVSTVQARLSDAFVPASVVVELTVLDESRIQVRVSGSARRVIGPMGLAGVSPTREVSATAVGTAMLSP